MVSHDHLHIPMIYPFHLNLYYSCHVTKCVLVHVSQYSMTLITLLNCYVRVNYIAYPMTLVIQLVILLYGGTIFRSINSSPVDKNILSTCYNKGTVMVVAVVRPHS